MAGEERRDLRGVSGDPVEGEDDDGGDKEWAKDSHELVNLSGLWRMNVRALEIF
jgi:hypothetical protein